MHWAYQSIPNSLVRESVENFLNQGKSWLNFLPNRSIITIQFYSRFDLGRAVGLKLTVTVFTAIESQRLAQEVGFETLYEIKYTDYKDKFGYTFDGIRPKTVKLMAARIE